LNGPAPKNNCGFSYFGILERGHNTILSDLASSERHVSRGCGALNLRDHEPASSKCIAVIHGSLVEPKCCRALQRAGPVLVASMAGQSSHECLVVM
jgi:hypothetical protein